MKRYIIKLLYFLIPIFIYLGVIIIIDPYEFINISHIIKADTKFEVLKRDDATSPRGAMLWKMVHFNRRPKKNLIIGDSQSLHIKEELVSELTGKDYFNFSVPGSSYETIFETFWYTTDKVKLESVYFQLSFMNFNKNRSYSLFSFGQDYMDRPYLYFTRKQILYDCYYNFIFATSGDPTIVQKSSEYFNIELQNEISERSLVQFFKNYQYPDNYQLELEKIVDYCKTNNIEVSFIVFPVYNGVHKYLAKNDLEKMNTQFKNLLKSLAYTYDLETNSDLKENRNNFSDFFHPKIDVVEDLTRKIWDK